MCLIAFFHFPEDLTVDQPLGEWHVRLGTTKFPNGLSIFGSPSAFQGFGSKASGSGILLPILWRHFLLPLGRRNRNDVKPGNVREGNGALSWRDTFSQDARDTSSNPPSAQWPSMLRAAAYELGYWAAPFTFRGLSRERVMSAQAQESCRPARTRSTGPQGWRPMGGGSYKKVPVRARLGLKLHRLHHMSFGDDAGLIPPPTPSPAWRRQLCAASSGGCVAEASLCPRWFI